MRASSIHLIYGSLLAAIIAGILHFQYCHKPIIDRYNQLASTEIQIIRARNKSIIANANKFVEEYDDAPNIFYLKKLWALDSIQDIAYHSLQSIPVDSIDGYEAIYKQHLKAVFQDEKYMSIPASADTIHFTHIDRNAVKNADYRAAKQLEYYFKTADIWEETMRKISADCGFGRGPIPDLLPPSGPPLFTNGYSINVLACNFQHNSGFVVNQSTRPITGGKTKIDTIFPKPGWYPFYAQVTTGGRFRTPSITQYDTVFVHVLPK